MKKFIIAVGLLLVAAVFMSGCITETEDPIVGIWHSDMHFTSPVGDDFDSRVYVFNADGSGFNLVLFAGEVVHGKLDFTWKNEGDGKYTVTISDDKGIPLSDSVEFVLEGEELHILSSVYHRESAAEYLVGLWASDLSAYDGPENTVCLSYIAEDGTGNIIVYNSDVMGIDDVYTTKFTWEEKDGVMYIVEEDGEEFRLTLKNGALS